MSSFSIGLSGIEVNQQMLNLIGQNISNANTQGYHLEVGNIVSLNYGTQTGDGATIGSITRNISIALDQAITKNSSDASYSNRLLTGLNEIQGNLAPGTQSSLQNLLSQFFTDVQSLSSQPDNVTQRQVVLSDAQQLTTQLNQTTTAFGALQSNLNSEGQQAVDQINSLASQIAQLNGQIQNNGVLGLPTNTMQDQRDQLINKIAQYASVQTVNEAAGQVGVEINGAALVAQNSTSPLLYTINSNNQAAVIVPGGSSNVNVGTGQLGAILALHNTILPQYQNQLDHFAQTLSSSLDSIQSSGVGLKGPLSILNSTRPVVQQNTPLDAAQLAFPVQAGTLTFSVTNQATGQRTTNQIAINPNVDSLNTVAIKISSIPNLQAVTNAQTGTITIIAKPGFGIDFAGRLSSSPDTQAITGTSTPSVTGLYNGKTNDQFTYTVVGTGSIGLGNLSLQVTNQAGSVLGNFNIGQGYQPGASLGPIQGVSVALKPGTVNNGDTFSSIVVSHPDTTGLVNALGLNTFFTGSKAGDIAVSPDLLQNPQNLGLSATGDTGDDTNLKKIVALQDQNIFTSGSQTASQFLGNITGQIGTQINGASNQNNAQQSLGQQLSAQQQSVSGVDPNEELVKMLQYQRGYQISAQYLSTVNTTLDSLFSILK